MLTHVPGSADDLFSGEGKSSDTVVAEFMGLVEKAALVSYEAGQVKQLLENFVHSTTTVGGLSNTGKGLFDWSLQVIYGFDGTGGKANDGVSLDGGASSLSIAAKHLRVARGTPCPNFEYKAPNNEDTLHIFRII